MIKDKVILISGGSDGIGKALAENLATNNKVVILSRSLDKTQKVAKEIGVDFVVADVANPLDVQKAVSNVIGKYGKVDILVNNAGLWIEGCVESNSDNDISDVISVNVLGVIYLTKYVVSLMKRGGEGRIVNVISQSGLYGKSERSVYHASKWAITGFTKSLEMELAPSGISICGFYPAGIKTGFFEKKNSKKDLSKYLEIGDVVEALVYILSAPKSVSIPELGIKHI